jgi:hypothetical protein
MLHGCAQDADLLIAAVPIHDQGPARAGCGRYCGRDGCWDVIARLVVASESAPQASQKYAAAERQAEARMSQS